MQTIRITNVPVLFTYSTELRQPLLWQYFCWAQLNIMNKQLDDFYSDLRELMKKHNLLMECYDDYNGHGEWCGFSFTLRSKEPVNDIYPIYIESLKDFVENGSD